eukprot:751237_1
MQGAHDEYYYIYHLLFRRVDLDSFFCLTSLSALFAFKIFAFLVYQVMISILSLSYPSNHQLTEDPNPPPYNPNDYPMAMVMETYRMVQMTMVCLALVIHNTMNPSIQTQAKMNALLPMFLCSFAMVIIVVLLPNKQRTKKDTQHVAFIPSLAALFNGTKANAFVVSSITASHAFLSFRDGEDDTTLDT